MVMPILPNFLRNIVIGLLLLIALYACLDNSSEIRIDWKLLLFGSLLYITYVFSLTYSESFDEGIRKLETGASLIVFPIIFSLSPVKSMKLFYEKLNFHFLAFILSTTFYFVFTWMYFWPEYKETLVIHYPTVLVEHMGGWSIHSIYLSMHAGISILLGLYILAFSKARIWMISILIPSIILILIFLLVLVKKGPLLSLVISGVFLSLALKKKWAIGMISVICVIFIFIISLNKNAKERFSELLNVNNAKTSELTSTSIRITIYSCAQKLLPDAGFLGYGIGDVKSKLVECYHKKNENLVERKYNSHNQYLSILLASGYLGLLCFSLFIIYVILNSYRNKSYLVIAVILFYCLVMFAENILEREDGVVYFCLFTCLLHTLFSNKVVIQGGQNL
jgi:hypothetical protein